MSFLRMPTPVAARRFAERQGHAERTCSRLVGQIPDKGIEARQPIALRDDDINGDAPFPLPIAFIDAIAQRLGVASAPTIVDIGIDIDIDAGFRFNAH